MSPFIRLIFSLSLISGWLLPFISLSASADSVYKQVQPDGTVIFSDAPTHSDSEAEKVEIEFTPNVLSAPKDYSPSSAPNPRNRPTRNILQYEAVKITSPANDTAMRSNEGTVSVAGSALPRLHPGHSFVLKLDGAPVGNPQTSPSFQLTEVYRGSHTLVLEVVDRTGKVIKSSEPVVFHLLRATAN